MNFHRNFADGTIDHTDPSRPGYRFLDTDDSLRLAADTAYEERCQRMADAWKHKGDPPQRNQGSPQRAVSLDALHDQAERAYHERSERLRNAWRHD